MAVSLTKKVNLRKRIEPKPVVMDTGYGIVLWDANDYLRANWLPILQNVFAMQKRGTCVMVPEPNGYKYPVNKVRDLRNKKGK